MDQSRRIALRIGGARIWQGMLEWSADPERTPIRRGWLSIAARALPLVDYAARCQVLDITSGTESVLFTGLVYTARYSGDTVKLELRTDAQRLSEQKMSALVIGRGTPALDVIGSLLQLAGLPAERIQGVPEPSSMTFEVSIPVSGVSLEGPLTLGSVELATSGPAQSAVDDLVRPGDAVAASMLSRYLQGPVWAKTAVEAASLFSAERIGLGAIADALAWLLLLTRYSLSLDPFGRPKDYERTRGALSGVHLGQPVHVKSLTTAHQWCRDLNLVSASVPFKPSQDTLRRLLASPPSDDHLRRATGLWLRASMAGDTYEKITLLWRGLELYAGGSAAGKLFGSSDVERLQREAPDWLSYAQRLRYHGWAQRLNESPLMTRLQEAAEADGVPLEVDELTLLRRVRGVRNDMEHGVAPRDPDVADVIHAVTLLGRLLVFRSAHGVGAAKPAVSS